MSESAQPQIEQMEIGVVVPSVLYAPVWIAERRGFLAEEGLSVRLRSFGTTDGVTKALRDGVVPVTIGSPEGTILDAVSGGDLRMCAGFVNKPPLSMIAQRRYRSLADLRGARLGTSSLKEGTCHLMTRMMAAHGLQQPRDFQFVLAGAHPQRWEALQAGTLDAAIQLVPFNYIAEEAGFPNLGDVDDYVPDFLFCAVCTRLGWAKAHARQLIGLLRALRRGTAALYADPQGAAATIADDVKGNPDHTLRACRDLVAKQAIPRDLAVGEAAFAATLDAMTSSELIPAGRDAADLAHCADFKFLEAAP